MGRSDLDFGLRLVLLQFAARRGAHRWPVPGQIHEWRRRRYRAHARAHAGVAPLAVLHDRYRCNASAAQGHPRAAIRPHGGDRVCWRGPALLSDTTLLPARRIQESLHFHQPQSESESRRMERWIRVLLLTVAVAALSGCATVSHWFHHRQEARDERAQAREDARRADQSPDDDTTPRVVEPQVERRKITVPKIRSANIELGLNYGALSVEDFGTNPSYG